MIFFSFFFFFQAEDGIRDYKVTGVQTCALPICPRHAPGRRAARRALPPRPRWRPRGRTGRAGTGREIGRASCRERSVDLGGRRIIKKKKKKKKNRINQEK